MYKEKKVSENKNFNLGIKFSKKVFSKYLLDNNKVITQKSEKYLQKSIFNLQQQKRLLSKKNTLLTV
jgi:hypothetical protein